MIAEVLANLVNIEKKLFGKIYANFKKLICLIKFNKFSTSKSMQFDQEVYDV